MEEGNNPKKTVSVENWRRMLIVMRGGSGEVTVTSGGSLRCKACGKAPKYWTEKTEQILQEEFLQNLYW